jgi:hypothetical protein
MSSAINKRFAGNPVGGRVIGNNIYNWVIILKQISNKSNFAVVGVNFVTWFTARNMYTVIYNAYYKSSYFCIQNVYNDRIKRDIPLLCAFVTFKYFVL